MQYLIFIIEKGLYLSCGIPNSVKSDFAISVKFVIYL